jgi:CSLREA domain-containing protein
MRWLRCATIAIALVCAGAAEAATLTVTTVEDAQDGTCTAERCTLRDAIAAAAAGDVVRLPASKAHYLVTLGEIPVVRPVTIRGAGAGRSVVDGRSQGRLFRVASAVGTGTVTFERLTLTGGSAGAPGGGAVYGEDGSGNKVFRRVALTHNTVTSDGDPDGHVGGGAIRDDGHNLSLIDSVLSGNSVTANGGGDGFNGGGAIWHCPGYPGQMRILRSTLRANRSVTNDNTGSANGGGAIYNTCSTMIADGSRFVRNTAIANGNGDPGSRGAGNNGGGAIFNDSGSGVTLLRSTVAHNTATARDNRGGTNGGGGILIQIGTLLIDSSTIAGNTADVSDAARYTGGGGILNGFSDGMTIRMSTISGNTANLAGTKGDFSGGGGVADFGIKPSSYVNVTVTGNRTNVPEGPGNGGGGLNVAGGAALTNVTLVDNASRHAGGSDLTSTAGSRVTVKSSIAGGCETDGIGIIESLGYNLLLGRVCTAPLATDRLHAKPRLGPLRDNGGPTRTLALKRGSPAVDAIPRSACTDQAEPPGPVTTDQRGGPREVGRCDIGAFERVGGTPSFGTLR